MEARFANGKIALDVPVRIAPSWHLYTEQGTLCSLERFF